MDVDDGLPTAMDVDDGLPTAMDSIRPSWRESRLPEDFGDTHRYLHVPRFRAVNILDTPPASYRLPVGLNAMDTMYNASDSSSPSVFSAPSTASHPDHIPNDALPKLRVHLRNHLSKVLPKVKDPDDMPLETMIHKHASTLRSRNREIAAGVQGGDPQDREFFEDVNKGVFEGSFFNRKMCNLLVSERILTEMEHTDDSSDEEGSDSLDDIDSFDDSDSMEGIDLSGESDASGGSDSSEDSALSENSGLLDENDSGNEIDEEDTDVGASGAPRFQPLVKEHTPEFLRFLTNLREWAINYWLLDLYRSILAYQYSDPDEIDLLFLQPLTTSLQGTPQDRQIIGSQPRPTSRENTSLLVHMQAFVLLLKLRLLLEQEQPDPVKYWNTDFEHPKGVDQYPGAFLYQQNMFLILMLHVYEEVAKRPNFPSELDRLQRRLDLKSATMQGIFAIFQAREDIWFKDFERREEGEGKEIVEQVEVQDELWDELWDEEREKYAFQFTKRLGLLEAPTGADRKNYIRTWLEGVGNRGNGYGPNLSETEKMVLRGTTFKVEGNLETLSRIEAEKIVTLHGGKIYLGSDTPPTHIIVPSPQSYLTNLDGQITLSEPMLLEYIHSKVIDQIVAGAHEQSLQGLKFEFIGILPTINRDQAIALVEGHGGVVQKTYGLTKDTDYFVPGIEVDGRTVKIFERAGVVRLDEEGLFKLIRARTPRYGLRRVSGIKRAAEGMKVSTSGGGKRRRYGWV